MTVTKEIANIVLIVLLWVKNFAIVWYVLLYSAYITWMKQWSSYALWLVVLRLVMHWHVVQCFTLCVIWKLYKFRSLYIVSSYLAITPWKQPKFFIVWKVDPRTFQYFGWIARNSTIRHGNVALKLWIPKFFFKPYRQN